MIKISRGPYQFQVDDKHSSTMSSNRYPSSYDCMPCSFLVNKYKVEIVNVEYTGFEAKGFVVKGYVPTMRITVDIDDKLMSELVKLWREQEPKYAKFYEHWPSKFCIGSFSAVENDRKLKTLRFPAYAATINKLIEDSSIKGADIAHQYLEDMYEGFSYGDHTHTYIDQHADSHPTSGISWNDVRQRGDIHSLMEMTEETMETWIARFYEHGDWALAPGVINFGSRARSPKLHIGYLLLAYLLRGRQIGFMPGVSTPGAFVKHEHQIKVLKKILDWFADYMGVEVITPKIQGGAIYKTLQKYVMDDAYSVVNYDVAGMEQITPSILNRKVGNLIMGIGCVTGYMDIIPELLSGVFPTSDFNIIVQLILIEWLTRKHRPKLVCVLGDDGTLVYKGPAPEIKCNLYELQDDDIAIHRTLGLTTTEWIHPVGLPISTDNAAKRVKLRTSSNANLDVGASSTWVRNKLNSRDRYNIMRYFAGWVGDTKLSDIIGKIAPQAGVYSPSEMIEAGLHLKTTGLVPVDEVDDQGNVIPI